MFQLLMEAEEACIQTYLAEVDHSSI